MQCGVVLRAQCPHRPNSFSTDGVSVRSFECSLQAKKVEKLHFCVDYMYSL